MKCIYNGTEHEILGGPFRSISNGQLIDYVLMKPGGIPVVAKKSKITFLTDSQPEENKMCVDCPELGIAWPNKCSGTHCRIKEEEIPVSNCCAVDLPDWPDSDICPLCKEHCGVEED